MLVEAGRGAGKGGEWGIASGEQGHRWALGGPRGLEALSPYTSQ